MTDNYSLTTMITAQQAIIETKDELHQRKMNALAKFVDVLLSSPEGRNVAKIILYGSVARGDEEEDSDIDVLVFTVGRVSDMERVLQKLTWNLLLTTHEHIPLIVYSLNEFHHHLNYFLYSALQYSKEVFSMSADDIKFSMMESNFTVALDYVETAEIVLANGKVRGAIDTSYNAAELIAKNFIMLAGKKLPTRHGQVIEQFSLEFVMNRQFISPEIGHALNVLLDRRHKARYDGKAELTKEMATEAIALARNLIERFRQYLAETVDKNKEDSDEQKNDS